MFYCLGSSIQLNIIHQYLIVLVTKNNVDAWVSGNDMETEGEYRWAKGSPYSDILWEDFIHGGGSYALEIEENWYKDSWPDYKKDKDCVFMNYFGKFNDWYCEKKIKNLLCDNGNIL